MIASRVWCRVWKDRLGYPDDTLGRSCLVVVCVYPLTAPARTPLMMYFWQIR